MVVSIRTIFKISIEEIKELKHNLDIRFEDGVILKDVPYDKIIIFRHLLNTVNFVKDGEIKITSDLWIDNFLEEGYFTYGTYLGIYSLLFKKFVKEIVEVNGNREAIPLFLKSLYKSISELLSNLEDLLSKYVIDVEIFEMLKIQFREDLMEALKEINEAPLKEVGNVIREKYKHLDHVLRKELDKENIIRLLYTSGAVSSAQTMQLFLSRGFITEIDSSIFKYPMYNSFILGFKNNYEMAIESRSAAKALYFSIKAIRESEYLAKQTQLATMDIEKMVIDDCGNDDYIEILVEPASDDFKGTLNGLIGLYYLNEETNQLEIITKDHKHLIGKTIKLRSPLNCRYRNKKYICSKCLGDLSYSIFSHQNLGHLASINFNEKVTQSILSIKHLLISAKKEAVVLPEITRDYFTIKNYTKVFFKSKFKNVKRKSYKLIIPQNLSKYITNSPVTYVRNFKDMVNIKDPFSININNSSKIYEIFLEEFSDKNVNRIPLNFKVGNRYAMFTIYFWIYLIKNGFDVDEDGNYVVDLSNWNFDKPIMEYEEKEFDFNELRLAVTSLLRKRKYFITEGYKRAEYKPRILTEKLFNIMMRKFTINYAILDIITYGLTAYDINEGNYDLSRNSPKRELIRLRDAIEKRSLGPALAWVKLTQRLYDTVSFKDYEKPDHPMDVIIMPTEVLRVLKN